MTRKSNSSNALSYEQWKGALAGERLPAAVLDLDAFDRNVAKLASLSGKKPLRLATKSLRAPALIQRALKSSHAYQGLMCFSCEEAAILAQQGLDDFLIAYPTVQSSDLAILRGLHESGKKVTLVIDSAEHLRALARAFAGAARPFPVVIDIDASLRLFGAHLGVRRSPIRTSADLTALLEEAKKHPELRPVGMMCYEAQVAGLGDRNPFKPLLNPAFVLVRKLSMAGLRRKRQRMAEAFRASGFALEIFNGGGTGSINLAADEAALTELTAGSALYSPHLFDYYSNIAFEPSLFFALQTVRSSDPDYVTCQGGGYIASGEPGWDRVPVPHLPAGCKLVSAEGCGEVQTPIQLNGATVKLGDPILFRHAKAGELCERFNEVLLVSDGKISDRAKTYRGLGHCFF